jgi:hypothetical protein
MAKQYVWNSDKEEFELVDVYEGVLAEFDRQDKAAAQQQRALDGGSVAPKASGPEGALRLLAKALPKVPRK